MKKMLLSLLLGITTMVFAGCNDPKPDPQPTPDPVPMVNLKLTDVSIMASSVKFKVESSDQNQPYIVLCVSKAFADKKEDKALITDLMADLKKQADAKSIDLAKFIESIANKGNKELKIENLAPGTDYTVIALAINRITPGAETARHTFTTLRADRVDCTFDVAVEVTGNNVKYTIKPSNKETDWYFCTMTKEKYDGVKAANGWDDNQVLVEYFAYESATLANAGMTPDKVLEQLLHKGDITLQAKGLDAEKEFVYLAGAIAKTPTGLVLVSDVKMDVYTTGKAPQSDMTFKVTVDSMRKTHVRLTIEPSSQTESYLMLCSNVSPENKDLTPTQMMDSYYKGLGFFAGMSTMTGKKTFDSYRVAAGLDYFVLVFGFSGGPTTNPEIVEFKSLAGQNPADATFATTINSKNPYGANLTFTPSDESVYFAIGLQKTGTIEKDSIIKYFELGLVENLKKQHEYFGVMNMTMADVIMSNYFHDKSDYTFSDLEPNTVYDLYIIPISMDGKVAGFKIESRFLTTPSVSSTTARAEVMGYFNGDDEAGKLFGDASATAGQSIIVLKFVPSDATVIGMRSAVNQDNPDLDEMDPTAVSDKQLRENERWSEVKANSPYQFILAEWDKKLYSFVYTATADGSFGAITRMPIAAPSKATAGTFDQLKALYDAAAATSKARMSRSMSKIIPVAKQAVNASSIVKKDGLSKLDQYVRAMDAKDKETVVAPYAIGASVELPAARIAR